MNKISLLASESREAFGVRRIPALLTDSRLVMRSSESAGMRRTPNASRSSVAELPMQLTSAPASYYEQRGRTQAKKGQTRRFGNWAYVKS